MSRPPRNGSHSGRARQPGAPAELGLARGVNLAGSPGLGTEEAVHPDCGKGHLPLERWQIICQVGNTGTHSHDL
jgi:hypothetical protein